MNAQTISDNIARLESLIETLHEFPPDTDDPVFYMNICSVLEMKLAQHKQALERLQTQKLVS